MQGAAGQEFEIGLSDCLLDEFDCAYIQTYFHSTGVEMRSIFLHNYENMDVLDHGNKVLTVQDIGRSISNCLGTKPIVNCRREMLMLVVHNSGCIIRRTICIPRPSDPMTNSPHATQPLSLLDLEVIYLSRNILLASQSTSRGRGNMSGPLPSIGQAARRLVLSSNAFGSKSILSSSLHTSIRPLSHAKVVPRTQLASSTCRQARSFSSSNARLKAERGKLYNRTGVRIAVRGMSPPQSLAL